MLIFIFYLQKSRKRRAVIIEEEDDSDVEGGDKTKVLKVCEEDANRETGDDDDDVLYIKAADIGEIKSSIEFKSRILKKLRRDGMIVLKSPSSSSSPQPQPSVPHSKKLEPIIETGESSKYHQVVSITRTSQPSIDEGNASSRIGEAEIPSSSDSNVQIADITSQLHISIPDIPCSGDILNHSNNQLNTPKVRVETLPFYEPVSPYQPLDVAENVTIDSTTDRTVVLSAYPTSKPRVESNKSNGIGYRGSGIAMPPSHTTIVPPTPVTVVLPSLSHLEPEHAIPHNQVTCLTTDHLRKDLSKKRGAAEGQSKTKVIKTKSETITRPAVSKIRPPPAHRKTSSLKVSSSMYPPPFRIIPLPQDLLTSQSIIPDIVDLTPDDGF
jgi:hypothetical protein